MNIRKRCIVVAGLLGTSVLAAGTPATATVADTTHIRPVITGLNNPRGLTFDVHGNLYVAQAGKAGSDPAGLTRSGKVTKFLRFGWKAWTTTFDSLYDSEGGNPDVIGPDALSTLSSGCTAQEGGQNGECPVSVLTGESSLGAAANGVTSYELGRLYVLNPRTGQPFAGANVGDQSYNWTANHKSLFPSDFPDANPYGVLVTRDQGRIRTFVADAGANTISEIMPNGHQRVITYIPNEVMFAHRDATPTCLAQGRDGMLYVGTLDLASNFMQGGGISKVWRVDPNANYPSTPTVWARGLTTVTSCTFDRAGNFWATEMFANNGNQAPPGDIVKVSPDRPHTITHYGGGQLPVPGGIAQGPDGAMYVSIDSASAGDGQGAVVRVVPGATAPPST